MATFCFDIDGVIATESPKNRYDLAEPINRTVLVIETLFNAGHEIILYTARGGSSGIDWSELTIKQMQDWCVKYHKLIFGKPSYDYIVDDKAVSVTNIIDMLVKEGRWHGK